MDVASEIISIRVRVITGNFQNNPSVSILNSPPTPTILTFTGNLSFSFFFPFFKLKFHFESLQIHQKSTSCISATARKQVEGFTVV